MRVKQELGKFMVVDYKFAASIVVVHYCPGQLTNSYTMPQLSHDNALE